MKMVLPGKHYRMDAMIPVLSYWNDMRRFARFVPCAQFKKREKHPHEGVLGLVKWQAEAKTLLHRSFSRCLIVPIVRNRAKHHISFYKEATSLFFWKTFFSFIYIKFSILNKTPFF